MPQLSPSLAADEYRTARRSAVFLLLATVFTLPAPSAVLAQPTTTLVSVTSNGQQGDDSSGGGVSKWQTGNSINIPGVAISGNGRWVAFATTASNLGTPSTQAGEINIVLRDRLTQTTSGVSISSIGLGGNGASQTPVVSADGRWVAFSSYATNLVQDSPQFVFQSVYVRDMLLGVTTRVSVSSTGVVANLWSSNPSISADGNYIAFLSGATNLVPNDTNGLQDVFVHDRQTGTTSRINLGVGGVQANSTSTYPVLSPDGRWVLFTSWASNLVPNDTNNTTDVFVYDRQTGTMSRVSVGTGGGQLSTPSSERAGISADGRRVVFYNVDQFLQTSGVFLHDRATLSTVKVSAGAPSGRGDWPVISADGRFVAFSHGGSGVFEYDTLIGTTTKVSMNLSGAAVTPGFGSTAAITADGRMVAFASGEALIAADANGRHDVFLRDLGPPPAPPSAPTGLFAESIVGNTVTLRWTAPAAGPAATGFVLEGGVTPGGVIASVPTGSVSPSFTFTAPTGSYYVRVHALNGSLRSAPSNEIRIHVNVQAPPLAPSAPANLLGLVNGTSLALAWTNTLGGGAPTSLVLEVTGAVNAVLSLGLTERFSFAGVPSGTYSFTVRAQNAGGLSSPSNTVALTFPGACSGPPLTPATLVVNRAGNTLSVSWTPAASGPAPTSYVVNVTGSLVGSLPTTARAIGGAVGPGSYTLSVTAINVCGASPATDSQTVVVP